LARRFDKSWAIRARSHSTGQVDLGQDHPIRPDRPQLGHDVLERRPQRRMALGLDHEAAARPGAGEVQDIVDQLGHAPRAVLDEGRRRLGLGAERGLAQEPGTGGDVVRRADRRPVTHPVDPR